MSFKLTDYLPDAATLSQETLLEVRSRLAAHLQPAFPDLDLAPNSVFGDLHLTPMAYHVAGLEAAWEKVMADLNLENVAAGAINSCDFVRDFLKNFAIDEQKTLRSHGLVRLTFSVNTTYVIDRRAQYLFGNDSLFKLRLPEEGALNLLPVGATPPPTGNVRVLSALSPTQFYVDVPVVGAMTSQVAAGTAGATDFAVTNLVRISAVTDFSFGTPPDSLAAMAKRTRQTFHAASLATRGGTVSFMLKEFPDVQAVSPVISNDPEMLRDTTNALGIADGRMDVYVKSAALLQETQVVRVNYYALNGATPVDKFVGALNLAHVPVYIDSIKAMAAPAQTLITTLYSQSLDAVRAPLATCAYSRLEKLWLTVNMPRDDDLLPLLERLNDTDGDYAWFEITYRYEPLLEVVDETISSSAFRPIGVDVLARAYLPIVVSNLQVNFYKPSGTTFNATQARDEILAYFQRLAYPDIYTDSVISDALLYAGATGVRSVTITAAVQWSVATRVVPHNAPDPRTAFAAFYALSDGTPVLSILSTAALPPSYTDPNIGTTGETLVVAGKRNVGFILDEANLILSEVVV